MVAVAAAEGQEAAEAEAAVGTAGAPGADDGGGEPRSGRGDVRGTRADGQNAYLLATKTAGGPTVPAHVTFREALSSGVDVRQSSLRTDVTLHGCRTDTAPRDDRVALAEHMRYDPEEPNLVAPHPGRRSAPSCAARDVLHATLKEKPARLSMFDPAVHEKRVA